jgi:hypothetical protein
MEQPTDTTELAKLLEKLSAKEIVSVLGELPPNKAGQVTVALNKHTKKARGEKSLEKANSKFAFSEEVEKFCDYRNSIPYLKRKLEMWDASRGKLTQAQLAELDNLYDYMKTMSPKSCINAYLNFNYSPYAGEPECMACVADPSCAEEYIRLFELKHKPLDNIGSFATKEGIDHLRAELAVYEKYCATGARDAAAHMHAMHMARPALHHFAPKRVNKNGNDIGPFVYMEQSPKLAFLNLNEWRLECCKKIIAGYLAAEKFVYICDPLKEGRFGFVDNQLCLLDESGDDKHPVKIFVRVTLDADKTAVEKVESFPEVPGANILAGVNEAIAKGEYVLEINFDGKPSLRVSRLQVFTYLESNKHVVNLTKLEKRAAEAEATKQAAAEKKAKRAKATPVRAAKKPKLPTAETKNPES